jgi:hypothetical protein
MPFSSTEPRGREERRAGGDGAAERQKVVLVATGAVEKQERRAARVDGRLEAVGEGEGRRGDHG